MAGYILEAENVSKSFGGLQALKNVNISVEKDKISALIGPNGAGKTTFFNIVSGTIPADSGKIIFKGDDITGNPPYECCKKGIARTYQQKNIFSNLSLYNNIEAGTLKDDLSPEARERKVMDIIKLLELQGKENRVISNLPPLDNRLVELGRSLATEPDLLLLDELIGGLVKEETDKICEVILSLKQEGYTIFQVGHEMGPIMRTSDWIYVLDSGENLAEGTPEDIQNNEKVLNVYLETAGEHHE